MTDDNIKTITALVDTYFGTLVLATTSSGRIETVKLVGITDYEDELYYKYDNGIYAFNVSCINSFIALKAVCSKSQYDYLVKNWNKNNPNKAL